MVMITTPSIEVASRIADALLAAELVACVNILPAIQSHYCWQGEIHHDDEVLMMAKTRRALFGQDFINTVRRHHPYDVPEMIALPILDGSPDYLGWIDEVTRK